MTDFFPTGQSISVVYETIDNLLLNDRLTLLPNPEWSNGRALVMHKLRSAFEADDLAPMLCWRHRHNRPPKNYLTRVEVRVKAVIAFDAELTDENVDTSQNTVLLDVFGWSEHKPKPGHKECYAFRMTIDTRLLYIEVFAAVSLLGALHTFESLVCLGPFGIYVKGGATARDAIRAVQCVMAPDYPKEYWPRHGEVRRINVYLWHGLPEYKPIDDIESLEWVVQAHLNNREVRTVAYLASPFRAPIHNPDSLDILKAKGIYAAAETTNKCSTT